MAREFYPTVAQVVSAAARGLGLVSADISDPIGSTDKNILQMVQLLNDLGQDLTRDHDWQQLRWQKTYDLSGIPAGGLLGASGLYNPLPSGFGRIIPESVWDLTNDQPLIGPVSSKDWAQLTAVGLASTTRRFWRLYNDMFGVYTTATLSIEVSFSYVSRFWVAETAVAEDAPSVDSDDTNDTRLTDVADEASDRLFFDLPLLRDGLKLRFAEAKGLPTEALQRRYEDALARAKSGNEPGRELSLNAPYGLPTPRVPDTGFGS